MEGLIFGILRYTQDTYCVKSDSFSTLLTSQDMSVTLSSLRDKVLQ